MLGEVAHEQVATAAGHARYVDVRRGERRRQRRVLLAEGGELLKHLPMTRRVRAAARDHVAPVRPVAADRVDVLATLGQRLAQRAPERSGRVPIEGVCVLGECDHDPLAVGPNRYLIAGEFLDQERGYSVTYDFVSGWVHYKFPCSRGVRVVVFARDRQAARIDGPVFQPGGRTIGMRIRGERECQDCGARWSYYETGSVDCPDCESLRSVGVDDRTRHTATAGTLDLSAARDRLDAGSDDDADTREAAEHAAEACREFCRQHGFIDSGELAPLDGTYLAALELRYVAEEIGRAMRTDDATERYFLSLLGGADEGERPPPDEVPESLRTARGLAAADAVGEYRREAGTYLDDHPDPAASAAFRTVAEHRKRVAALDGGVAPTTAERLLRAARDLGRYLRSGDEGALVTARDRLDRLRDDV